MIITIGIIQAIARMKDELTPKLGSINKAVQNTGQKLSAIGKRTKEWGRSASAASAIVVAGVTAAGLTFANFESRMNRVEAVSGATEAQMVRLTAQAKELGSTTQFSASQAAEGMGFLAQAGFEVEEVLAAMPDTLNLAAAGQLGLAEAADIASNVLSGFGFAADEVSRVADVMALTSASANTNIQMMGESFAYVGPVAAAAGQDFEMIAAMVGKLGDAGIQASSAGTALRGIISRLAKPGKDAAEVFERIGLSVNDASGKMRPLNDIMRDLGNASLTTSDQVTVFGKLTLAAGAVLSSVTDDTDELTASLKKAGGTAERMAKTQMKGLGGSFVAFKSAAEGVLIAVGEQLAPMLTGLARGMTSVAQWVTGSVVPAFDALSGPVKAIVFGLVALVAAIGPVAVIGGTLISMLGFLVTGFSSLLPVMAAVKLGSIAMWGGITGGITIVLAALWLFRDQVSDALGWVVRITARFADGMLAEFQRTFGMIPGLTAKLDTARAAVANWGNDTAEALDRFGEKAEQAKTGADRLGFGLVELDTDMAQVAETGAQTAVAWKDLNKVLDDTSITFGTASNNLAHNKTIVRDTYDAYTLLDQGIVGTAEALLEMTNVGRKVPSVLQQVGYGLKQAFSGAKLVDGFTDAVNSMFGSGNIKRALGEQGRAAADWLGTSLAAGLSAIPVAGPFLAKLGPALGQGIKALGSKVGGWFKGLFGKGTSEAEEAAEAMAEVHRKAAEEAAEAWRGAMEHASGVIKNAYTSAREAAVEAYAATYEAAMAAGLGAAEAARMASGAQIHGYQLVMAAAKEKYIQDVALEAAIKAIREGNGADAARLAREAAAQASAAYDIMTGVMHNYYTNSGNRGADAAAGAEAAHQRMADAAEAAAASATTSAGKTVTAINAVGGAADNAAARIAGIGSNFRDSANAALELTAAMMGVGDGSAQQAAAAAAPPVYDASYASKLGPQNFLADGTAGISQTILDYLTLNLGSYLDQDGKLYMPSGQRVSALRNDDGSILELQQGSGGIRDWGTQGTPATLHGREAVVTQDQIERMIAAAAGGGGGLRDGDTIIVQVDGEDLVGRVIMDQVRAEAQSRAY